MIIMAAGIRPNTEFLNDSGIEMFKDVYKRQLGNLTTKEFDPILMLDSFDSINPDDYTAGFPMHPHRCSVLVLPLLLTTAVGQMWIGFGLQRNKKE